MFQDYLAVIAQGIPTSLSLTAVSLLIAFVLAVILTFLLSMESKLIKAIVNGYLMLFTGTPLLVQFFLIYHGPGQFQWIVDSFAWQFLSDAWFCAALALALNSAAYSTQLFHGAVKAIPKGQWETCAALGLSRLDTLKILIPYALRRALPSYSNEIILVFKGTSLASTITLLDIMGYARQLYGTEYDAITIYGIAGAIYLVITGIMTILLRRVEAKVLAFERPAAEKA
ncbi:MULTISPECIES: arginine ABC transporter permease ArtM [Actinobacillus]|uniref:Arginine ABC transporter permease protein ArtM n=1 Tax=Actinobacillus pleuropneumoniae serovar 6 str. Femo TaxID=754256 RepID=A0A828PSA3_ACTPL|nr:MULTISPECIES: arginine ABC transporter permease ArtM [Actinobacillus]EFL80710.1 arginine transporter permease subunit ArtM [Actinobacillus pleuropneumoniae serovar 6 str. Femo]EFM91547.1 Arginine ABC transporter permease protein artM [Actinobacillus pleuropneumoniae serovar 6 str. Femo]UKH11787.1 arginine ABC transporter permease ArtM [Actinobacillus pleuropneumoniae serovar 6 str. Femo]UKH20483.1 arginine ABC transporter permease ArtM [Actinobacillus pleuropneumoniae]UPA20214.1 arginine AB